MVASRSIFSYTSLCRVGNGCNFTTIIWMTNNLHYIYMHVLFKLSVSKIYPDDSQKAKSYLREWSMITDRGLKCQDGQNVHSPPPLECQHFSYFLMSQHYFMVLHKITQTCSCNPFEINISHNPPFGPQNGLWLALFQTFIAPFIIVDSSLELFLHYSTWQKDDLSFPFIIIRCRGYNIKGIPLDMIRPYWYLGSTDMCCNMTYLWLYIRPGRETIILAKDPL